MKKIVRLTENQLYKLVEQALNELDWRTYQSARDKRNDQYYDALLKGDYANANKYEASRYNLQKAAQDAFNKKYGYDSSPQQTQYNFYTRANGQKVGQKNGAWAASFDNPNNGLTRTIQDGESTEKKMYGYKGDYGIPENGLMSVPDREIADFQAGKSKYIKGKGWSNESLARRVTESVIRKLRRLN